MPFEAKDQSQLEQLARLRNAVKALTPAKRAGMPFFRGLALLSVLVGIGVHVLLEKRLGGELSSCHATPHGKLLDSYDAIAVGGGTAGGAGAILASELATQTNWTILLLDAGPCVQTGFSFPSVPGLSLQQNALRRSFYWLAV
jgi:hypothetical protein